MSELRDTMIGQYAPDFELPGIDEEVHHLAAYLQKYQGVVVVFMCNHCPYVGMYINRLKQVQSEFIEQGICLVGINPNDAIKFPEDSFEKMKTFAQQHQLNFPYIRDVAQDVSSCFGVQKTPEVFLLNRDGIVCYQGQIDDNPNNQEAVEATYLHNALTEFLAGNPITLEKTEPVGCSIKWRLS